MGGGRSPAVAGAGCGFADRPGLRAWSAGALVACAGGLVWAGVTPALGSGGPSAVPGPDAAVAKGRVAAAYGRLPLAFEPNRGQAAAGVRYLAHGPGYGVFITADRTMVALAPRARFAGRVHAERARPAGHRAAAVLSFRTIGGNADPVVAGRGPLPGRVSYLRGRDRAAWRTNVPTYREVTERGVYRGVDLRWYGTQQGLEYDVAVAPGADPGTVGFAIGGLRGRPHLTRGGDLVMPTAAGDVVQRAPHAYQVIGGTPRPVPARFTLGGADRVGFAVAGYDHRRPLVIDPGLVYSTYLGGTGYEEGNAIAVDSAGSAYIGGDNVDVGADGSAAAPMKKASRAEPSGGYDMFVTKLNPTGTAVVYSTFIGGSGDDAGLGLAVDSAGSAYLTGETESTDFPTTAGAYHTTYGGGGDAFVTKLDPDGSGFAYSTYLGGNGYDQANGITVDASGHAYLTGVTYSGDFPHTTGPPPAGSPDAFVTELDAGGALAYSTFLGGTDYDEGDGIGLDSSGNAYVTGLTSSENFPTTTGAFQGALAGALDAFVTKLDPTGTGPVYSTYLGGAGSDLGYEIAVGSSGNAYVTGLTGSRDFPTTRGASQTEYGGGYSDAFVTALNATGTAPVYSTYLGGAGDDQGDGIAVDTSGNAYVTGATDSRNFPITSGAFQSEYGGGDSDAYVTKLDPTGTAPAYSTYLGGAAYDEGDGIAVDSSGNAYLTGVTDSANFPTTPGAFQTTFGGGDGDAFVTKLGFAAPTPTPTPRPPRPYQRAKQRQAEAGTAVAHNNADSSVTGNVDSHLHSSGLGASRSRAHLRRRRGHARRWGHR